MNQHEFVSKFAVRFGLVALLVSVAALMAGANEGTSFDDAGDGFKFVVDCTRTDAGPDGGSTVTCALKVSGLPAPLAEEVVVSVVSMGQVDEDPLEPASSVTVVASEAPNVSPDGPALVSRRLPLTPPTRPPRVPDVPQEPPQYV